jgi:hypothetical protein
LTTCPFATLPVGRPVVVRQVGEHEAATEPDVRADVGRQCVQVDVRQGGQPDQVPELMVESVNRSRPLRRRAI